MNKSKYTPEAEASPPEFSPLDPVKELSIVHSFVDGMSVQATTYIHGVHYGQVETAIRKQFRDS